MCPGAKWPSISPIGEINGDAIATPSVERDELAEGREKQGVQVGDQVQDPVQGVPMPPEPHTEVRAPRVARRPFLPTKADIDEHYPLHLNYRSWCDHCVAGRARLAQHVVLPSDRERLGVTVHMDYAFMTAEEALTLGVIDGIL